MSFKRKITQFSLVYAIVCILSKSPEVNSFAYRYNMKKSRCLNPPRTARRVENVIKDCQEEVKNKLLKEAFEIIKEMQQKDHPDLDLESYSYHYSTEDETDSHETATLEVETNTTILNQDSNGEHYEEVVYEQPYRRMSRLMRRISRVGDLSDEIYHPSLLQNEDKLIAGCLLHCVYAKNNAIDKMGWPTLDGLVDFYSEGVNEHGFFMATLRSVNLCLHAVTKKYQVNRKNLPENGESCDLAFDVFDCISDQITGYCLDQYKH